MENPSTPLLPRVTIQFCTQCKWMLRAAYFAQELLSTFSTSLGEVALQPSAGGTFTVHLYHAPVTASTEEQQAVEKYLLWDRKTEGGFPETKELKRRVRDIIDPSRNLGHVDRHDNNPQKKNETQPPQQSTPQDEGKKASIEPKITQPGREAKVEQEEGSAVLAAGEAKTGKEGCEDCV